MRPKYTTNNPSSEIPYGYCQCGCGEKTSISNRTRNDSGHNEFKGEPLAFIKHHSKHGPGQPPIQRLCQQCGYSFKVFAYQVRDGRGKFCSKGCQNAYWIAQRLAEANEKAIRSNGSIPVGLCQCGCGQKTNIAAETARRDRSRTIKGQPLRFINGHQRRLHYAERDVADRFWEKVDKNGPIPEHCPELGPCWVWQLRPDISGYGRFRIKQNGKQVFAKAHRVAYELSCEPIPHGLWVLHKCDNPPCVNPAHLYVGTPKDNTRDSITRGRHYMSPHRRGLTAT